MTQTATPTTRAVHPPSGRAAWGRYVQAALWVFAVGAVALLVTADLLPQWLDVRSQPYLTLAAGSFVVQTLQIHIGVGCLLCFLVAAVRRRWWLALVAGMAALLGVAPMARSLARPDAPAPAGATMRLMSINLNLHNRNVEPVLASIRRAAPDVLILQEYATAMDGPIRAGLAEAYPYQLRKPLQSSDGWAVYSRRPLLAPIDTSLQLHESKRQARFAVRLGGKEVLIYALHLTCPKSIERIGLNRAEVADLVELIATERKPVILAGDFNFTGASANAAALRAAGLRSTHVLAGETNGSTWRYPKLRLPRRLSGLRIDDVYIGPQLTCRNARVLGPVGSDHRPIIADIALAMPDAPGEHVASAQ